MRPGPLADILDSTADACHLADDVAGWSPEQVDLVLDRLEDVVREETSLTQRLRLAVNTPCEPPGEDGLCPLCHRKLAEPLAVEWPGHGCNPFDFLISAYMRVRRLVVRTYRLTRLLWVAARYSRGNRS